MNTLPILVSYLLIGILTCVVDRARARLKSLESRMAELEGISEHTNADCLRGAFLDARDVFLDEAE